MILRRDYTAGQKQGLTACDRNLAVASDEKEQGDEAISRSETPQSKWDPQNFESLTVLAKEVYLVESSQTKQLYAMKVKSKSILQQNSETETVGKEKAVLLLAKQDKCPFVVEVFGGFHTQSHVQFYLEFCQGGNLMHHIQIGGRFGRERAR